MSRRATTRKRPLSTIKKIERAVRRLPVFVLIGLFICVGLFVARKIMRPVILYARDMTETVQTERELSQVREENKRLQKQINYLKTPEGTQTEARKLGYIRPGEVSFVLQHPPKQSDQ